MPRTGRRSLFAEGRSNSIVVVTVDCLPRQQRTKRQTLSKNKIWHGLTPPNLYGLLGVLPYLELCSCCSRWNSLSQAKLGSLDFTLVRRGSVKS